MTQIEKIEVGRVNKKFDSIFFLSAAVLFLSMSLRASHAQTLSGTWQNTNPLQPITLPSISRFGTIQTGVILPGVIRPGEIQSGEILPSVIQPGEIQAGVIQPGIIQPGVIRPGEIQPGVIEPGVIQPGMIRPGD
ncbi:MAG: hypothetical protein ACXVLQ_16750 [Bacteriovorax sp.]